MTKASLRNFYTLATRRIRNIIIIIMAKVQYQGKHSKILATIFLLLPTVLNSRVSHYSGRSYYFSCENVQRKCVHERTLRG